MFLLKVVEDMYVESFPLHCNFGVNKNWMTWCFLVYLVGNCYRLCCYKFTSVLLVCSEVTIAEWHLLMCLGRLEGKKVSVHQDAPLDLGHHSVSLVEWLLLS